MATWYLKISPLTGEIPRIIGEIWHRLDRPLRKRILSIQLLSIVSGILEVATLGSIHYYLKLLTGYSSQLEYFPANNSSIHSISLLFVLVLATSASFRIYVINNQLVLGAQITSKLAIECFNSILKKEYAWHKLESSHRLLRTMTSDMDRISATISGLLQIIVNIFTVLLLAISMAATYPAQVALISAGLAISYGVIYRIQKESFIKDGKNLSVAYESSLKYLQDMINSIKTIKIDNLEQFFSINYYNRYLDYRLASADINRKSQIPRYILEAIVLILMVVISSVSIWRGTNTNIIPMLGTLGLASYRILQPASLLFSAIGTLQANKNSFREVFDYACSTNNNNLIVESQWNETITNRNDSINKLQCDSRKKYITDMPLNSELSATAIKFENISYQYNQSAKYALKNISLTINGNEKIALVGKSGSGKTTFIDILMGLLTPTSGRLLISQGKDLYCPYHPDENNLIELISHAPQDIYILNESIESNIALADSNIDEQRLINAARLACMHEFIESLPSKYKTKLSDKGGNVSGGQRQRIGIARALYKRSPILILDEATSALDISTERDIISNLAAYEELSTIVMITHRPAPLRICDRIIVFHDGIIVGDGTYEQLEASHSLFRNLVSSKHV